MSFPILIGMMAQMMLNIIDGIYAGHLGQQAGVAVLNYGFPVFYLLFAFFNGLSIGTNSVLARFIGAKRVEEAEKALGQILWICFAIFLVVVLAYPLAMPWYLHFLKADEVTSALTHQFLSTLFLGMPFVLISLSLGGGLRAEGNMRVLATGQMLAVFANILIAPFFIFGSFRFLGLSLHGFDWGVRGAGLASTVASALGAAYIARLYLAGKTQLQWIKFPKWDNFEGVKGIFKVGVPSSVSQILIGINWILMTRLAAGFGVDAVAAIGIGGREPFDADALGFGFEQREGDQRFHGLRRRTVTVRQLAADRRGLFGIFRVGDALVGAQALMFDLEQVAILKGPQALFFGKNSPAGVISITTAGPTKSFEVGGRVGYEFVADEVTGEGHVSGPITDTLGARVAIKYRDAKGWLYNNAQPTTNPFFSMGGTALTSRIMEPWYCACSTTCCSR